MGASHLGGNEALYLPLEWFIGWAELVDHTFLFIGAHVQEQITLDLQVPPVWGVLSSTLRLAKTLHMHKVCRFTWQRYGHHVNK